MNLSYLEEFNRFLDKEASLAVSELSNVAEKSRQHLQKLVYTNIVDRFDTTIDHLLIDNVLEEPLLNETLSELKSTLNEGEILRLLLKSESVDTHVREKTEDVLRNGILRQRHSKKLRKIFESFIPNENCLIPRINPSNGSMTAKFKPQNKQIPCSIIGYADWLYSRRNAIVHGGGSVKMLGRDLEQLNKLYKCDACQTVRLKIGSINNAIKFYREVVSRIK